MTGTARDLPLVTADGAEGTHRRDGAARADDAGGAACCTPLADAILSEEQAARMAARLRALADPQRLRLMSIVLANRSGGVCQCDLTDPLGLSQPTVSHHLRILVDAALLDREQRGRWAYYRAIPESLAEVAGALRP